MVIWLVWFNPLFNYGFRLPFLCKIPGKLTYFTCSASLEVYHSKGPIFEFTMEDILLELGEIDQ